MVQNFAVVRSGAPVREQAVRLLREAITSEHFVPGMRLGERELLKLLNVSRTTVREALRQLEAEGLVVLVPGKGPVVTQLTNDEARQIYEAREALECFAVRLFVRHSSRPDRERLRESFETLRTAYPKNEIQTILSAKDSLYEVIYEGAQNTILHDQARALHARIRHLRAVSLSHPGRPDESLDELSKLVDAIEHHDEDLAAEICSQHVRGAARAADLKVRESPGKVK